MGSTFSNLEQLAIGIDIGGTGTKFGIVDRVGNLLFSSEMSTRHHNTIESFIEELHQKMLPMIGQAGGIGRFIGIGVGARNGNY
ncbi:MAG: ROK family protein, partial [Chitinophagaceae bacterium]|nr:ROK family protein [Chitinophagaceae bacterium]